MKNTEPTQRQLRVGEHLRHVIAEVLQRGDIHAEGLENTNLITVSEVRIGPDLKNATAYVSLLGQTDVAPIVERLNEVAPQIRHEIGRKIELKYTPKIKFKADSSLDYASHIDELLRSDKVRKDLEKKAEDGTAQ